MCHRQFKNLTLYILYVLLLSIPIQAFEFYDIWLKIFHNISGIVCDRNCSLGISVIYNYISSHLLFPDISKW